MTTRPADDTPCLGPFRLCFAQTLTLLVLGLVPVPIGWARSAIDSARSTEPNRVDRESTAGGYYEGLIGVADGSQTGRGELAMRLMGKPTDWVRFHAANVCRQLGGGDFLQFELKPNINQSLFGKPFTTNEYGMRDRPYTVEKPEGVYRIALLGSSIDMGWGIGTEETYVNLLEDWLNAHAAKRGLSRRFQVLNFAVAAYSPLQRLESFRRKALPFKPDLVIYSATMLDQRLMEIHLCDLFRGHSRLTYDFLREAVASAGLTAEDLRTDPEGRLVHKETVKRKLRPYYWGLYDATLGTLAADCRSEGIGLACLIIPRVGKADAADARAEPVARFTGIAAHQAVPLFDLSGTFDDQDSAQFQIAPWDDHPNALGHRRLFLRLSRALVDDPALYSSLFPPDDRYRARAGHDE
ncbi:MAG: hypothetical protein LC745_09995 [Planctomycetia bacterium]|nr:hypothetical protein [Planctomycetia bacterium]